MKNRELRELKNIKRELQRKNGINKSTELGNGCIKFILFFGIFLLILIAIWLLWLL